MALKIKVEDRVSTYPGRVVLTPVPGETDTYVLSRADEPVTEGTRINKELFDNKAYTLTEDVTVYVSTTGNDVSGDGSSDAPYKTIQKAVDSIPKHLDGYTAQITIANGTYPERVTVEGFTSGRVVVGRYGDLFTINGIDIINCSFVETNISRIERLSGNSRPLFVAKDGSNVFMDGNMVLDGIDGGVTGAVIEKNSHFVTGNTTRLTCNNCAMAVSAQWCSFVSLNEVTGTGNVFGLSASQGSIVSYKTDTLSKSWSNNADSGGLVLTGNNSSDLSGATLDL